MRRILFLTALLLAVSAEAKPKAAPKTPITWSGPLLVHEQEACDTLDEQKKRSLTYGLLGRTDLVEPDGATLTPVRNLQLKCSEVQEPKGRDWVKKRIWIEGFDKVVLSRETLGGAAPQAVTKLGAVVDAVERRPVSACSAPEYLPPGCKEPTCSMSCLELPLEGGVRLQFLSRVEAAVSEEHLPPSTTWVRVAPFSKGGDGWVEADTLDVRSAFVRPGVDVRLLLVRPVNCHGAYQAQMVRWTPDGKVEKGSAFSGGPGLYAGDVCDEEQEGD